MRRQYLIGTVVDTIVRFHNTQTDHFEGGTHTVEMNEKTYENEQERFWIQKPSIDGE